MPGSAATPVVLTYHRIGDPRGGPPGMVSATRKTFERQMRWLAGTGRAVSLDNVLRARDGGAPLPRGAVLVTFDDAYCDFDEHAWPVLRRLGIPVALFVATAYPGAPGRAFWWDRLFTAIDASRGTIATPLGSLPLHAAWQRRRTYRVLREHVKSLPHDAAMALVDELVTALAAPPAQGSVLSWPALRRLAREGVALGAHSRTHPLLSRVPEQRIATEVAGSVEDLHRETGRIPSAFAFPGGAVPPGADRVLRAAGIRLAFTTCARVTAPDAPDWLALGRINIARRTGRTALRARLAVRPHAAARVASAAAPARVAYVMSRFPKLTETFVLGEVLALERRGIPVDLYPLLRERAAAVHPEAARLVERARYEPFLSPAIVVSQLVWLRRRPGAYLRAWRDVLLGTWGSPNFFVGAIGCFPKVAHAARRMQAEGVTHVHCHFANHPALAGLIVHRLTEIPFSFTAHGSDLHKDRRMLARKVAEAAFVATISHDNHRLIISECGEHVAGKVHVLRAGVDTRLFAPSTLEPAAQRRDALRIVCVGTLHEVKGQPHLIEACRLFAGQGIDVRCTLIGGGPDEKALRAQIEAAGVAESVVVAGPRTRQQIVEELRHADALVAPSVPTRAGRREGIPVALMEAMSTGLPVVASAISGIPELVEDEVSGLLVPPGDAAAIARALRQLAADPALRERLGRAARDRVLAEFDLEASASELARRFGAEAVA
jgi:glycosyltransferase involved in cell wall biosynthesis/peptidoglycan/xylan/chitin deacetylase (PgdA/CDA1 family)